MELPTILKKQLLFGDRDQLDAIKRLQELQNICDSCDGEGQVECSACRGSGKKSDD